MCLHESWSLSTGHLQLLERDDDGLSNRYHETQDKGTLLLVTTACLVCPTSQQRRVAAVTSCEDEDSHTKHMGNGPSGENGVDEGQQTADCETDRATTAHLVGNVARRDHEDEVDCADAGWDVIDLRHRVHLSRFEVEGEVLDDVGAAGESPEAVSSGEGVDLPRTEDAADDGPVHLTDGLAALFLDALTGTLLFPVAEIEGLRGVWGVREADLAERSAYAYQSAVGTVNSQRRR